MLFESVILCDDIRFEATGKLLLIGVYSDIIQVPKLPLQLRSLSLAIKAKATSTGHLSFSVSVADPQGNALLDAGGELNYEGEAGRVIWLPVVMGPALLTTEGAYSLTITLGDGTPVHETFIVRKPVAPQVQLTSTPPN